MTLGLVLPCEPLEGAKPVAQSPRVQGEARLAWRAEVGVVSWVEPSPLLAVATNGITSQGIV